jgi:hypothetical protein
MLSRALSLATVTLLTGCVLAGSAHAQATNLEAGKSPSQIFAGTCNACHKTPRGLLKTVPASSLPGFLRQHYTTSSDMASVLSSFLVSNGANDTRYQARQDQSKQGKDVRPETRQEAKQEARPAGQSDQLDRFGRKQRPPASTQEAARPDTDGLAPQGEGGRAGRNGKRLARPGDPLDAGAPPDAAAGDSKSGARQKLSKRAKPGDELPKSETAKPDAPREEAAKPDTAKDSARDAAKGEGDKPVAATSAREKSETAKVDGSRETRGGEPTPLRPDPVPPVTPAPPQAAAPASTAGGTPEPVASPSVAGPPGALLTSPSMTASVPPPPVAPAAPPAPPISQ